MMDISFPGVLAAALSSFVLGGLWYSPLLFGRKWQVLTGLTDAALAQADNRVKFGLAFLLSLLSALVFALFLGPDPAPGFAAGAGFAAGLCWVAASFGINYLFEHKSLPLFLINGGYHTVQFTLIGLVLGLV